VFVQVPRFTVFEFLDILVKNTEVCQVLGCNMLVDKFFGRESLLANFALIYFDRRIDGLVVVLYEAFFFHFQPLVKIVFIL
jgi:hypothetical protein